MEKRIIFKNHIPFLQDFEPKIPEMHKFDNWFAGTMGLLGGGISKTFLSIPSNWAGFAISLAWAAATTTVGYLTKKIIDWIIKRVRIFIGNNRTKKP